MVLAAGGKPLIFTEIGSPSSTVIGSSTARQQSFYSNVFDYVQGHSGGIAGGSFFQMMDLPPATVQSLLQYYNAGNPVNFGAHLARWHDGEHAGVQSMRGRRLPAGQPVSSVCTLQTQSRRCKGTMKTPAYAGQCV
jgi:hypothetical protein